MSGRRLRKDKSRKWAGVLWVLALLAFPAAGCSSGEETRVTYPVTVPVTYPVTVVVTAAPSPEPTLTPTPEGFTGSMEHPVPLGETRRLVLEEGRTIELAVEQAYRGAEAWSRIYAANPYNDLPPEDQEYLLLWAEVVYVDGPAGEALNLNEWSFRIVSKAQILKPPAIVEPEPAFSFSFFPGGSDGGWMAWLVHEDDPVPLLAVGADYKGRGGVFFSTAGGVSGGGRR